MTPWAPFALLTAEWEAECRNPSAFVSAALFALLVLLTQSLAYPERGASPSMAFAIFFVSAFFSAILAEHERTARDRKTGIAHMLALAPVGPRAIFLSRALIRVFWMTLTQICLLPFLVIFFNVSIEEQLGRLAAACLLSNIALAGLTTLLGVAGAVWKGIGSALALPVLILPLAFPILALASVGIGRGYQELDVAPFLKLLLASDIIVLTVGCLTYGKLLGRQ